MSIIAVSCASSDRQHEPYHHIRRLAPDSRRIGRTLKDGFEGHRLLRLHLGFRRLNIPALHHLVELRMKDNLHHRHVLAVLGQVDDIPAQDERAFVILEHLHPVENQPLARNGGRPPDQCISSRRRRPAPHDRPLQKNKEQKKNQKHGTRSTVPGQNVPQRRPFPDIRRRQGHLLFHAGLNRIRNIYRRRSSGRRMKHIFKSLQIDGRLSLLGRRQLGNFFMKFFNAGGKIVRTFFGMKDIPATLFPFRSVRQGKPDVRTVRTLDLTSGITKIVRINLESACTVRAGEYHRRRILLKRAYFL